MLTRKSILIWLYSCIALIFIIIIVGGYTRLTHSGLSIVEWKPISGVAFPLSESSWQEEFQKYQQSPEYHKINYGMKLNEFKEIYFVEWIHRILGRLIGLVFLLPFLYFAFSNKLSKKEIYYFLSVGCLIGLQGGVGWLMVKSGLVDNPNVSQYRLAIHLMMACIVLILLVWKTSSKQASESKYAYFSCALLMLQIISGAFVAGLHAGLVYNSFPLMDGQFIPDGVFLMKPLYINFFENITMVQFTHRILGLFNAINILAYCIKIFKLEWAKKIAIYLSCFIVIQILLGILTLILQVPLFLALLHQAMAIILLITMVISLRKE